MRACVGVRPQKLRFYGTLCHRHSDPSVWGFLAKIKTDQKGRFEFLAAHRSLINNNQTQMQKLY
jgi:hypothetical protein